MPPVKIGVLISGGGTNLQSIMDGIDQGKINGKIELIISNNKDAFGLERGKNAGIESIYINPREYESEELFNKSLLHEFQKRDIQLIVLAGYLKKLSTEIISAYTGRIINIHPSLIPSFCGKGFYGKRVHEEVLKYGVKITGATVHFVDENMDTGPIILQKAVNVDEDDTVDSIQKKVLSVEHHILSEAVRLFCEHRLYVDGRLVRIV